MAKAEKAGVGSPVQDAVARHVKDPTKSYADVAEAVRREVSGAQTSARSVASEVRILRVSGVEVPSRRRGPATAPSNGRRKVAARVAARVEAPVHAAEGAASA